MKPLSCSETSSWMRCTPRRVKHLSQCMYTSQRPANNWFSTLGSWKVQLLHSMTVLWIYFWIWILIHKNSWRHHTWLLVEPMRGVQHPLHHVSPEHSPDLDSSFWSHWIQHRLGFFSSNAVPHVNAKYSTITIVNAQNGACRFLEICLVRALNSSSNLVLRSPRTLQRTWQRGGIRWPASTKTMTCCFLWAISSC